MPLALALTLLLFAGYGYSFLWSGDGADLASLFVAARLMAAGHPEHIYASDPGYMDIISNAVWIAAAEAGGYTSIRHYIYLYPPLWAAALAPIACRMDFATFHAIVVPAALASIAITLVAAAATWNRTFLRPLPLILLLAAVFASWPMYRTTTLGQVQPLVALLVVTAMIASQRGRPAFAGCALALAASVKLVPALLALYWLFSGRRTAALWFAGTGAALAVASVVLAGWPAHATFLERLREVGLGYSGLPENQAVIAWIGEILTPMPVGFITGRIWPVPGWVRGVVLAAAAAAVIAICRVAPRDDKSDALAMSALFLIAMIASPIAWFHYLCFLAVPLMILAARPSGLALALAVVPLVSLPWNLYAYTLASDGQRWLAWSGLLSTLLVLAAIGLRLKQGASPAPTCAGYVGGGGSISMPEQNHKDFD